MPTDSHRRPPLVHALPEEQILAGGQGFVELSRTRGGKLINIIFNGSRESDAYRFLVSVCPSVCVSNN